MKAPGKGIREIAREVGRDPGTISRELRRNAATPRGGVLQHRPSAVKWAFRIAARFPPISTSPLSRLTAAQPRDPNDEAPRVALPVSDR